MTTRWNIQVTEADIERAHKNNSYQCVVSQAIARTIPDATRIETDIQTIRFTTEGQRFTFLTPYAVQGYVVAFDAGDEIKPFTFHLRDGKRVRRNVKTEAGKASDREYQRKRKFATSGKVAKGTDREAVLTAYSEKKTTSDKGGPKPPPRVFKKKNRSYGHRLLRINQESE